MEKYTISEYVTLPSKGLVYDKKVVPEIHMSSMTTRHEMQRLSPSKSQFKVLCDIIDDCILDDIGISSYDMCTGDYQFLLFKLRIATYGSEVTLNTVCPHCGDKSELKLNLDDLKIISDIDSFNKYKIVKLPKTGRELTLKYQTPHMLDKVIERVQEFNDRAGNDKVDQTLVFTIKEIIDKVDNHTPDPLNIEDWIRNLPMLDTNIIFAHTAKMDETVGIDTNLEVVCDRCGEIFNTTFKAGPEFFRPEINI